jgi:hypothetical protein
MTSRSSSIAAAVGTAAMAVLASVAVAATDARADTLDEVCQDVDRTPQTRCTMERSDDGEWVLETSYEIGTGRKGALESVEARFCDAARRAGVSGRVFRESEIPGAHGEGAVMQWDCDPPAVSSPPRRR